MVAYVDIKMNNPSMAERFIDFTTDRDLEPKALEFALGNPVQFGDIPSARQEVVGIRIDKEPVDFADDSVASLLHKALIDGQLLSEAGYIYDAYTHAALLSGEIDFSKFMLPVSQRTSIFRRRKSLKGRDKHKLPFVLEFGDYEDMRARHESVTKLGIVSVESCYHDSNIFPRTVASPVNILGKFTNLDYTTKLGKDGPVVLASIEDIKSMYEAYTTRPIEISI